MTTTIYVLTDPRNGAVRYVGKTNRAPEQRRRGHIVDSRRHDRRSCRWITSLLEAGVEPQMRILEECGADWEERERYWIAAFRAQGADLTNHADGGGGTTGFQHTAEVRERMSEERRQRWADPEYKAMVRERMVASASDPAVRAQRTAAVKAASQSAESRARRAEGQRRRCAQEDPETRRQRAVEVNARPDVKRRIAETAKARWADPAYRARVGQTISAALQPHRERRRQLAIEMNARPEIKLRIAEAAKARWADPEYRARVGKKISAALLAKNGGRA